MPVMCNRCNKEIATWSSGLCNTCVSKEEGKELRRYTRKRGSVTLGIIIKENAKVVDMKCSICESTPCEHTSEMLEWKDE